MSWFTFRSGATARRNRGAVALINRRAAALAVAVALVVALAPPPAAPLAAELQTLEIVSKNGVHVFAVELAATDEERARGLMFRTELPDGRGMLFDFKRDQEVAMWMENTHISLDMIFIRADGRIARIAENTTPFSRAIVPSGGPVRGVLEVIGGTARKLGLGVGDQVAHPAFTSR
ncbi:MAG: DUF192 domain-containing protein [Proteobacteria bacterium]|nr:DUF192 domain-containing protein [Pseudomonadota bacterium]